jgi:O-antigen ligase
MLAFIETAPLVSLVAAASALTVPWIIRWPWLACTALIGSLVVGQLVRIPLPGQGGGLLVSDAATVGLLLSGGIVYLRHPKSLLHPWVKITLLAITPFLLWSLMATLIHVPLYTAAQNSIIFFYWLRLACTLTLLPALLILFTTQPRLRTWAIKVFLMSIMFVLAASIIQWIWWPDLTALTAQGWDPHQGRVVATWFDPNFLGMYIIMALLCVAGIELLSPTLKSLLLFATAAVLTLTQSRSSWLALLIALILASPFCLAGYLKRFSPSRIVFLGALLGAIGWWSVPGVALLGERAVGIFTTDPTVQLRLESLREAALLAQDYGWFGSGYNAYQYVAAGGDPRANFTIHSRAGTDNSLLTLAVTTGLIGVALFLGWLSTITWLLAARFHATRATLPLTTLCLLIAWIIHSQLVNSLLYTHLLITAFIAISLAITASSSQKTL